MSLQKRLFLLYERVFWMRKYLIFTKPVCLGVKMPTWEGWVEIDIFADGKEMYYCYHHPYLIVRFYFATVAKIDWDPLSDYNPLVGGKKNAINWCTFWTRETGSRCLKCLFSKKHLSWEWFHVVTQWFSLPKSQRYSCG